MSSTNITTTSDIKSKNQNKKDAMKVVTLFLKQIDEFLKNNEGSITSQLLTATERSIVHDYAKKRNLSTESISVVGSDLKYIKISKITPKSESKDREVILTPIGYSLSQNETQSKMTKIQILSQPKLTSQQVEMFSSFTKGKFSTIDPKYAPYFVELYTSMIPGYQDSWTLFNEESQKMDLDKEFHQFVNKFSEYINSFDSFKKFIESKVTKPQMNIIKKDVYSLENVGKTFLSIDIKKGNLTIFNQACPGILNGNWESVAEKFTTSKFLAQSKYCREVVFNKSGSMTMARCQTLQEIMMERIYQSVVSWLKDQKLDSLLELKMKAGDELVFSVSDTQTLLKNIESIRTTFGTDKDNLHVKVFTLDQIGKNQYFLKKFLYSTNWNNPSTPPSTSGKFFGDIVEFKKVPSYFMPQVIKWYLKEKVQDEDLIFDFNGTQAKFMVGIFD